MAPSRPQLERPAENYASNGYHEETCSLNSQEDPECSSREDSECSRDEDSEYIRDDDSEYNSDDDTEYISDDDTEYNSDDDTEYNSDDDFKDDRPAFQHMPRMQRKRQREQKDHQEEQQIEQEQQHDSCEHRGNDDKPVIDDVCFGRAGYYHPGTIKWKAQVSDALARFGSFYSERHYRFIRAKDNGRRYWVHVDDQFDDLDLGTWVEATDKQIRQKTRNRIYQKIRPPRKRQKEQKDQQMRKEHEYQQAGGQQQIDQEQKQEEQRQQQNNSEHNTHDSSDNDMPPNDDVCLGPYGFNHPGSIKWKDQVSAAAARFGSFSDKLHRFIRAKDNGRQYWVHVADQFDHLDLGKWVKATNKQIRNKTRERVSYELKMQKKRQGEQKEQQQIEQEQQQDSCEHCSDDDSEDDSPPNDDVCFGIIGIRHPGTKKWRQEVSDARVRFGSFSEEVYHFIRAKDNGRRYWLPVMGRDYMDPEKWVEATSDQIRRKTRERFMTSKQRRRRRKGKRQREQNDESSNNMPPIGDVCFGRQGSNHPGTMKWRKEASDAIARFGSFSNKAYTFIRKQDNGRRYWVPVMSHGDNPYPEKWVEATDKQIQQKTYSQLNRVRETQRNRQSKQDGQQHEDQCRQQMDQDQQQGQQEHKRRKQGQKKQEQQQQDQERQHQDQEQQQRQDQKQKKKRHEQNDVPNAMSQPPPLIGGRLSTSTDSSAAARKQPSVDTVVDKNVQDEPPDKIQDNWECSSDDNSECSSQGILEDDAPAVDDVCFGSHGFNHPGTMKWRDEVSGAVARFGSFSNKVYTFIREQDNGRRYWVPVMGHHDDLGAEKWLEATNKQIRRKTSDGFFQAKQLLKKRQREENGQQQEDHEQQQREQESKRQKQGQNEDEEQQQEQEQQQQQDQEQQQLHDQEQRLQDQAAYTAALQQKFFELVTRLSIANRERIHQKSTLIAVHEERDAERDRLNATLNGLVRETQKMKEKCDELQTTLIDLHEECNEMRVESAEVDNLIEKIQQKRAELNKILKEKDEQIKDEQLTNHKLHARVQEIMLDNKVSAAVSDSAAL